MCPSYLATRDEKDSTRGRARVLQELANGSLVNGYRADELTDSLDLCLSCKGCSADCPAGVDMATYKAEVLYQRYRRRLRPPAHYALGLAAALGPAGVAHAAPGQRGAAQATRWPRWPSGWAGSTARRPLPQFAGADVPVVVRRRAGPHRPRRCCSGWTRSPTTSPPRSGRPRCGCCEAAGYDVRITEKPVCCGLTWISTGQLDGARRQLHRTLDALDQAVRFGTPIVGLEPSCTAVLRHDVVELLPGDPRAARVAAATRTVAELLAGNADWTPPSLAGVRAVAQPHCHQHAVMGWEADAALLAGAGASVVAR